MGKLRRLPPRIIYLALSGFCGLVIASTCTHLSHAGGQTAVAGRPSPFTILGRLLWLVGKPILLIVGVFVGLILLLNLYGRARELAGKFSYSPAAAAALLAVTILSALLVLQFLPRSEALILRSWEERTGGVGEESFLRDRLFGTGPNRYKVNVAGRVTSLDMHRLDAQDIKELSGLERLTSLRHLDLSDTPLEGTLDVSALTSLQTLRLRNTRLTRVVGVERLAELGELDLEGSPVEGVYGLGNVRKLNLSRTNVTDLRPLTVADRLEELRLEGVDLGRVDYLEQLWGLRMLSLNGCRGVDLKKVNRIQKLEALFLDHTDVSDLTPLAPMQNLKGLSIVGTPVEELTGLEYCGIEFLITDNPAFTDESVAAVINRPVVVMRADIFKHRWVPPSVERRAKAVAAALALLGLFLLLPPPAGWRTRLLLKVRRVLLVAVPGALLVLLLWVISSIDVPVSVVHGETPSYVRAVRLLMWFVAGAWLVAAPLLSLLTDTKVVASGVWSVPAHLLSRALPPVAAASPLLLLFGSGVWGAMSSPAGKVILILLFIICCCVTAIYGIILAVWAVGKRKGGDGGSYPMLVPFGVVVAAAFAAVIINFFGQPGAGGEANFALFMLLPSLPVLWFSLVTFFVARSWHARARELRRLLSGEQTTPTIIEVPLRKSSFSIPGLPTLYRLAKGMGVSAILRDDMEVVSAQNVGQVARARVRDEAAPYLRGLVLVLQHRELVRAKRWELEVLTELVREIYRRTWAPIWLVGDWIGTVQPASAETRRRTEALESLVPYLSGLERFSAPGGSVFDPYPPDAVAECLRANHLVPAQTLTEVGLPDLLRESFTPVAVLCRGVFGQASVPNRVDSLVRAAETAAAATALALVAERDALRGGSAAPPGAEKIDRSITKALGAPVMFSGWVSLLDAFAKGARTPLALHLARALAAPVRVSQARELRAMVDVIGGENAVAQVGPGVETCRDALSLLRAVRNVISAHGPANERAAPELYSALLVVTLDFLSALPWSSFAVQTADSSGCLLTHRGCLPAPSAGTAAAEAAAAWVVIEVGKGQGPMRIDASRYFRAGEGGRSLALYTGPRRFTDPASGAQLSGYEGVADAA